MHLDERVQELLNGGDWACAYAQHETLADVARRLCRLVPEEAAGMARQVAVYALTDLPRATALWSRLGSRLRYGNAA